MALMAFFVVALALGLLALVGRHMRLQYESRKDYDDGILHIVGGKLVEAAEALSQYNETHPDDPRGLEWLAFAKLLGNQYEEALDAAEKAIDSGKAKIGLWIKGDTLLSAGAAAEALAVYEVCAKKRPKPRYIAAATGIALVQLRRLDDAKKTLQSQKRWRNIPSAALALGEAFRLSGDFDAALKVYEAAALGATVEASLRGIRYRPVMACALAHIGKLMEAKEAAQSALAADAANTTALSALALIQKRTSDLDGLQATVERMLDASPPEVVRTLGDPEFTPLLADERFRRLLGRAWLEQNRLLERIRRRAPTSYV